MDKKLNTSRVYDEISLKYLEAFPNPSEYIDSFLKLIPKNGRILDFGCGVGVDCNYIHSKGYNVEGIDISKGMLKIAKRNHQKILFHLKDIRDIEGEKLYDGIVASCSLIHISKKEVPLILRKFNSLLKERGAIYLALQEGFSQELFVDEPFKPDDKLFLNIFSLSEIKRLLNSENFSVIEHHLREAKSKEELNYNKLFIIARKDKN
jgi:cyclopropane fatty-acyl-phospholipid synthase-like methyltransferase